MCMASAQLLLMSLFTILFLSQVSSPEKVWMLWKLALEKPRRVLEEGRAFCPVSQAQPQGFWVDYGHQHQNNKGWPQEMYQQMVIQGPIALCCAPHLNRVYLL